jgi:hypothetical protein
MHFKSKRNSSILTHWQPGSSLESEARGVVHCNAICKPVDCVSAIMLCTLYSG